MQSHSCLGSGCPARLNLCKEYIRNIALSEKLAKMEDKTKDADRAIAVESEQECLAGNNKVVSLNTGNCDVGSDEVNSGVDTREIISRVKQDLLSRLNSVAAGAA